MSVNLCSLTLAFVALPSKHLSVVSRRTGSGKSLLLAALIGKTEILGENQHHMFSENKRDSWFSNRICSSDAMDREHVIKGGMLFGLPFDIDRYRMTPSSCALPKDLETLPDGDLVGRSGESPSQIIFTPVPGFSFWMICLALWNSHVASQIFHEALTGGLGQGRTRILGMQHIELCLPRARYAIRLGQGTVEHASYITTQDLRGSLTEKVSKE